VRLLNGVIVYLAYDAAPVFVWPPTHLLLTIFPPCLSGASGSAWANISLAAGPGHFYPEQALHPVVGSPG
jgi:hypothetical protein